MNPTKTPIDHLEAEDLATLTRERFEELTAPTEGERRFLTLFMPMETKGAETRKNPIVFKNALTEAEELLDDGTLAHETLGAALDDLKEFAQPTAGFWQHQRQGLAMVITDTGEVSAYKLPFRPEPSVLAGPHPYLGRLAGLLDPPTFAFLALDLNELRLFEATSRSFWELDLGDIPTSLDEAMKFDDPEKSLQFRGISGPSTRKRMGGPGGEISFHGHGMTGDEAMKKRVGRFFEMIDKHIAACLPTRQTPLVLFGPEWEIGHYREASSYHHLSERSIAHNSSNMTIDGLREKLTEWIAARENEALTAEINLLNDHLGQAQGSAKLEEIALAAVDGRIDTLFLKSGERKYGKIDRSAERVEIRESPRDGDVELLDTLATHVVRGGGRVRFLDNASGELPAKGIVAATFRF